jgi:hypothetical protein
MAYFASEIAKTGYPIGGPKGSAYYPGTPAIPPVATNPHGIANTPDEYPAIVAAPPGTPYAYAYSPQTFEEKIAAMVPPGTPVTPVSVQAFEAYPTAT